MLCPGQFLAKGIGTRLKRGSTPGSCRRCLVHVRGSAADGFTSQERCRGRALMWPVARAEAFALDEGDTPPVHDRVGQVDLLDTLYREERPSLLRFLCRWTAHDKAEDIVQQLFSRMSASQDEGRAHIHAPTAYLRQAARNVLRDEARAAARTGSHHHVPIDDVIIAGDDPIAALEARDRLARIEDAVMRLKPLTREIFLACRIDGYSYAEIAERTGLSVKGVEKQMSRAIKILGRHLRAHD